MCFARWLGRLPWEDLPPLSAKLVQGSCMSRFGSIPRAFVMSFPNPEVPNIRLNIQEGIKGETLILPLHQRRFLQKVHSGKILGRASNQLILTDGDRGR
jgi:hypothetical protein